MPDTTGVTFGDYHSYKSWGLRLKEYTKGFPSVPTDYLIDVPGRDGPLDVMEGIFGKVVYGQRELKFVFGVRNCTYANWETLLTTIATAIHGQRLHITPDTDPDYYYVGRCEVSTEKSNSVSAQITVTCTCDPYKYDSAGNKYL